MADPEPESGAQHRVRNKDLIVFVVAAALFLGAFGYLGGSMLGWWKTRPWAVIGAGVAEAVVLGLGRLWNK